MDIGNHKRIAIGDIALGEVDPALKARSGGGFVLTEGVWAWARAAACA